MKRNSALTMFLLLLNFALWGGVRFAGSESLYLQALHYRADKPVTWTTVLSPVSR